MYALPKRIYRNKKTGQTSPRIADVVDERATVVPGFSVGVQRGWWRSSPFREIDCPMPETPQEVVEFTLAYEVDSVKGADAVPLLFETIRDSIERSWLSDKFHVVFCSAGYDSRIISGAIRALVQRNGEEWLGRGLLFLSNRWESAEFTTMMQRQGWRGGYYAALVDGKADEHFNRCLNFRTFWYETNAPTPMAGNLWWYLPDWAQKRGLIPQDEDCQGYAGYWANETWHCLCAGGIEHWQRNLVKKYAHHAMATLPFKIPLMEFPLSDLDVLRILPAVKDGAGKTLREAVAAYASPEAIGLDNPQTHDRKHIISEKVRADCFKAYRHSWYRDHIEKGWKTPTTSGFANEWGRWGLASLCQHLVGRGVDVR